MTQVTVARLDVLLFTLWRPGIPQVAFRTVNPSTRSMSLPSMLMWNLARRIGANGHLQDGMRVVGRWIHGMLCSSILAVAGVLKQLEIDPSTLPPFPSQLIHGF